MQIRIMQYSLSIIDLYIGAIGTYAIIFGIAWMGLAHFIATLCGFFSFALCVRACAYWIVSDGPLVGDAARDSFAALTLGLIGITILLLL
jgi:hypothetical protein